MEDMLVKAPPCLFASSRISVIENGLPEAPEIEQLFKVTGNTRDASPPLVNTRHAFKISVNSSAVNHGLFLPHFAELL